MSTDRVRLRRGPAGAALDVLLTDAAVGNPASRALRQPRVLAGLAAKVATHPDRLACRAEGPDR
jgi:hypothetical protein